MPAPQPGATIPLRHGDSFVVGRVLGTGGMGSVFRATQLAMDRKVAVKLLKPHLTSDRVATVSFQRARIVQSAPRLSLRTTRPPAYWPARAAQSRPGVLGSAIKAVTT